MEADRNVSLTWKFPTLYLGVSKYVLGPVKKIKRHFSGRKRCRAVLTLFKQKRATFEKVSDSVQFSSLNQPQNSIKNKTHKPWAPTNAFFLSLNFFNSSKTTSRNLEGESFYIKTTKYLFLRTFNSKSNGRNTFLPRVFSWNFDKRRNLPWLSCLVSLICRTPDSMHTLHHKLAARKMKFATVGEHWKAKVTKLNGWY